MEVAIAVSKNDRRANSAARKETQKGPIQVEILGSANAVSRMTAQVLDAAMRDLGLVPNQDIHLDFVRDAARIAASGVYWTPAVRINGALKCTGRVPSLKEVRGWLQQSAQGP
ncbi:MAG: thioredoxin family protein [bacterium]